MSAKKQGRSLRTFVFIFSLLTSAASNAWFATGGYYHGHDDWYSDRYGGGYYGWSAPNVVITVPTYRYYVPHCQTVQVCDAYDECWLEKQCE